MPHRHSHGRRPSHPRAHLSLRHRRALYASAGALWLSGAAWLVCHYALRSQAQADLGAPHPWEPWWLRAHGAALLAFLVSFGALLPGHIVGGWRRHRNRASGASLIALTAVLTLTGYALYYAGSEELRAFASPLHWSLGLMSLAALLWHLVRRRLRARGRSHPGMAAAPAGERPHARPHFGPQSQR